MMNNLLLEFAMEWGYRALERGLSIQASREEFHAMLEDLQHPANGVQRPVNSMKYHVEHKCTCKNPQGGKLHEDGCEIWKGMHH